MKLKFIRSCQMNTSQAGKVIGGGDRWLYVKTEVEVFVCKC